VLPGAVGCVLGAAARQVQRHTVQQPCQAAFEAFVVAGGGGAYLDALADLRGLVAAALALALRRPQVISDVGGRFLLGQAADG
jgi:phage-related baseplate assembly protein